MINYKLCAEVARAPGGRKFVKYNHHTDQTAPVTEADKKFFWERMEAARIFVFDGAKTWPMPENIQATEFPDLAVPFETCWFENLIDNENENYMVKIGDEDDARFIGFLIHEIAPTQYDLYALGNRPGKPPAIVYFPVDPELGNAMAWLIDIFLNKLRHSACGTEDVKEKVKLGSGTGQKHAHTIRRIVRVVPGVQRLVAQPRFGRHIDWTHRWAVRGHWRKHEGLGKNRAGEYSVVGFTWVSEHVRGPEDAPLIQKVRFVS